MAGGGRYPKPGAVNRNERELAWESLPLEGRQGPAPTLPDFRVWQPATLTWWTQLWSTPQAVKWDSSGRTLHALAILHHQLVIDGALPPAQSKASSISAEMRQIEDRHGLSPKAMLQLRWRVSSAPADGSGKVLHLVPREVAERVAAHRPDPRLMPAKRAAKAAWVKWAVLCGVDRATAEKLSKPKLIAELSSIAEPQPAERPAPERPVSSAVQRLREGQAAKQRPARPARKPTKKAAAKKPPAKGRGRKR